MCLTLSHGFSFFNSRISMLTMSSFTEELSQVLSKSWYICANSFPVTSQANEPLTCQSIPIVFNFLNTVQDAPKLRTRNSSQDCFSACEAAFLHDNNATEICAIANTSLALEGCFRHMRAPLCALTSTSPGSWIYILL